MPESGAKPLEIKVNILLIEDVQSEVVLTRISLDNANLPYGLTILKKGSEVVPYLSDSSKPKPDVLLLDMMLPDMDGFEIMAELGKTPLGRTIPIILLSGRDDLEEIKHRFPLNIIACMKKPLKPQEMRGLLLKLQRPR